MDSDIKSRTGMNSWPIGRGLVGTNLWTRSNIGRRTAGRTIVLSLCAALLIQLFGASIAYCEERKPKQLEIEPAVDIPITLAAIALSAVPELIKGELEGPWCAPGCDKGTLNALDETVVGNRSEAARLSSDVLVGLAAALPFAAGAVDTALGGGRGGWRGYATDSFVIAEALAVNFALNQVVKFAVRRPRPYVYDPAVPEEEKTAPDAALSFYSGHTSTAFCAATAYSFSFTVRHGGSRLVLPVWLGSHALAAATAVLRVEAGKHFWTDVITGAVVGSSVGLIVAWLHLSGEGESETDGTAGAGVFPFVGPSSAGLVVFFD